MLWICLIINSYLVLEEPSMQIRSPQDFRAGNVCVGEVVRCTVNASNSDALQGCTLSLE